MKQLKAATLFLLMLVCSAAVQASLFDRIAGQNSGPMDVNEAYRFSAVEQAPGHYRLHWAIEDGYYLYRDKIKVLTPDGVELASMQAAPAKQKDDPLFGQVWVYYHEALVNIGLESASGASGELKVEYQGCWEGGVCYPPVMQSVTLGPIPVQAPALTTAEAAGTEGFSLTDQTRFSAALAGGDLWLTLSLFFVAGLALAFTPCVLPMIPILASVIAGRVGTTRSFAMAVVYVLAMSLTYTVAGVFAGLFGENLQAALQADWVIVLFSLIFVLLSGAMFGFYQLQMPQAMQNGLNRLSRHQQGGHFTGVAVMGVLSALIVGPCVAAPLAGALIYIGQSGDPVLGGAALFVLSLGMGVPLLFVGASAGRLLPKAGAWMEQVKSGFGFVLLLMAVWMLDRILPPAATMVMVGALLVIAAMFLHALEALPEQAGGARRLGKGLGLLLLIYGGSLLVGAAAGNSSLLYPLKGLGGSGSGMAEADTMPRFTTVTSLEELQPILDQSQASGTPVMLDFYADWCVSCKELETFVFADAGVQEQLGRFALVRVDVTAHDDAAKALYQQYSLIGPPALIFYDVAGTLQTQKTIIGVPGNAEFAAHLAGI
ncbi:MAG TPA: protein-disulfide reductase DsbD [Motiliproteus sp.]